MYEIHQTQGIKAKKYSIWLGSDEVVRSQSKVAVQKLLIHLNGDLDVRPIPTDLQGESGQPCSTGNSSTTNIPTEDDELRNGIELRRLDQEFEKFLSDKTERDRQFEINSRERDRQFELDARERDRQFEEFRKGFDDIIDIVSELSSLSESRLRNYEEQNKLPCSSITSEVRRLEPLTIDVEAVEPITLHIHGTETSEYL